MEIEDYVRMTTDVPPILSYGEVGKVEERWTKPTTKLPASWVVSFHNGLRSHFVYEDELEVLELRVAS